MKPPQKPKMHEPQAHSGVDKVRRFLRLGRLPPLARKILVAALGGFIVIIGIIMIVAPGPAIIVIPLGLLVLATEFQWAESAARKMSDTFRQARQRWTDRKERKQNRKPLEAGKT